MKFRLLIFGCLITTLSCCNNSNEKLKQDAQKFIDGYSTEFLELKKTASEAQWKFNTEIREGDSTNMLDAQKADEVAAAFTGSKENIRQSREYLDQKEKLDTLQVKQLERILFIAADNPAIVADVVKERIKAENEQTNKLYGFEYMLDGKKNQHKSDRCCSERRKKHHTGD